MPKPKRRQVISLLLNEEENRKLRAYADFKSLALSEVLRDYIKTLPDYTNPLFREGF